MDIEKAIKLLVNAEYSDKWQGNEDLTTAHNMAIKALKKTNVNNGILANIQNEINNLPTYLAKFRDGKISIQIEKGEVDKIIKRYRIGK